MEGCKYVNIGYENYIAIERIVSILNPNSSPAKKLITQAKADGVLINAVHGRKTRSLIITDTNYIFLSAFQPETLMRRLTSTNPIEEIEDPDE